MQRKAIAWKGSIELLFKSLEGGVNPGSVAREHKPDDPPDVVISEISLDGIREVPDTNRRLGPILVNLRTWQRSDL